MERVVVEPGAEGLAEMLGDLIRGNLLREPERERLVTEGKGRVNLRVVDAEVDVGLRFTGEQLRIGARSPRADLSLACDSETLMQLTNVPLRFGMPDQLTREGRAVTSKMLSGELKVRGLPRHLPLMIRLQRLFTVT